MAHRPTRTTIYIVIVTAILVGATGYAIAKVSLLNDVQTAQGEYVGQSGSVPGVADHGVLFSTVPTPAPGAASTTATALTVLVMGGAAHVSRYCVNTCTAGDYADEFEYGITAQAAAEGFEVTIAARSGANTVSVTVYFSVPATAAGKTTTTLELFADLTTAGTNTSGTSALTQCSTSTHCP